jgi:Iap family predicted aminopeptidase
MIFLFRPRKNWAILALFAILAGAASGTGPAMPSGESFEEAAHAAHVMLTDLCDEFGGRKTGTAANSGAMRQLVGELRALGLEPEMMPFKMPGWERGVDTVELVEPFERMLRVAAVGYTQPQTAFSAEVLDLGAGKAADFPKEMEGRVVLLGASSALSTDESARMAASRGAKGVLLIDREAGGQLLARTGNFLGRPLPIPVYCITQEEGLWLQRLLARNRPVRVKMTTRSHCKEIETANLVLRFKGRSPERVIVGAHFDSWDLSQGTLDNGLGIAQLFALARVLRGRELARTVELVWFNGEEQGLWGSRHAAAQKGNDSIVAMVNLDMVGVPIAVNALGDESSLPALERWNNGRGAHKLQLGVQNINWMGSDHTPYQLAGVRTITFNAPIPRDSVRYYHDFADTIDKLPEKLVVDSTAIIGDLLLALINDPELSPLHRTSEDTKKLFTTFGLERRMQSAGLWPFESTPK